MATSLGHFHTSINDNFHCIDGDELALVVRNNIVILIIDCLDNKIFHLLSKSEAKHKVITATIHPLPSTTRFSTIENNDPPSQLTSPRSNRSPSPDNDTNATNNPPLRIPLPSSRNHFTHDTIKKSSTWATARAKYKHLPAQLPTKNNVRKLALSPAQNIIRDNPRFQQQRKTINLKRSCNIKALLIQIAGVAQERKCTSCEERKGPWDLCVTTPFENSVFRACANCTYNSRSSSCTFYQEDGPHFPSSKDIWTFDVTVPINQDVTNYERNPNFVKRTLALSNIWKVDITNQELISTVLSIQPDIEQSKLSEVLTKALTMSPTLSSPEESDMSDDLGD
ncbi:hypothetical protein F4818DRAFT_189234 [Hypoxylon cercidicola]|nr:hypothetical protein F4818DRAFT_189234 [Hypoxylon cercidicola]